MPVDLAGLASLASGIFGLFKKKKSPGDAARSQIVGSARGAREAGEKYGFNPLTLLGLGQGASAGEWGAPPLASFDLISGGLDRLQTSKREQAEEDRAELENDLLRIELDKLRSGVVATDAVGQGPSPLGQRSYRLPEGRPVTGGLRYDVAFDPRVSDPPVFPDGASGGVGVPDARLDSGTGLFLNGFRLEPPPGWSNGQAAENELGEGPVSWLWQLPYVGAYAGHNLKRAYRYAKFGMDVRRSAEEHARATDERMARRGTPIPTNNIRTRVFDPFSRDGYTYRW